ncbi:MAG: division/cell wall cluster transcriptional repressor MraZ [Pirellulales bacterium]
MLLTGTFLRSVDEKLRIAIPKRLRDGLAGGTGGVVYVAPGTDKSLAVYSEEAFSRLGDRLAKASPAQQDVRAFSRLFYAQAQCVELDGQGRARIPQPLANLAGIGKEVVLVGVQDHLEVWDKVHWDAYLAEKQTHYDELAEAAFGKADGPPA